MSNATFRFRTEILRLNARLAQTVDDLISSINAPLEVGKSTPTDLSGATLALQGTIHWAVIGRTGGRQVIHVSVSVTYPTTADTKTARVGNLPFAVDVNGALAIGVQLGGAAALTLPLAAGTSFVFRNYITAAAQTNAQMSGVAIIASGTYLTAI